MSDPKPGPPRWKRLSNPVTPTVVTFAGGDSATAKPFVRLSNPVTPTVVTFARPPILFITLRRHPGSDDRALPLIAALLIGEVSKLEQAEGGHGMVFDRDRSVEEPTRLVLRLFPKLIDGKAAGRVSRVADALTRLAAEAPLAADLLAQTEELGRLELARALSGAVEMSVEVAA